MPLRYFQEHDVEATDAARREHLYRAFRDWREANDLIFWLLGSGARDDIELRSPERSSAHGDVAWPRSAVVDARRAAEQRRKIRGWTMATLEAAREYALAQPGGKVMFPRIGEAAAKPRQRKPSNPSLFAAASRRAISEDEAWIPIPWIERDWLLTFSHADGGTGRQLLFEAARGAPARTLVEAALTDPDCPF